MASQDDSPAVQSFRAAAAATSASEVRGEGASMVEKFRGINMNEFEFVRSSGWRSRCAAFDKCH